MSIRSPFFPRLSTQPPEPQATGILPGLASLEGDIDQLMVQVKASKTNPWLMAVQMAAAGIQAGSGIYGMIQGNQMQRQSQRVPAMMQGAQTLAGGLGAMGQVGAMPQAAGMEKMRQMSTLISSKTQLMNLRAAERNAEGERTSQMIRLATSGDMTPAGRAALEGPLKEALDLDTEEPIFKIEPYSQEQLQGLLIVVDLVKTAFDTGALGDPEQRPKVMEAIGAIKPLLGPFAAFTDKVIEWIEVGKPKPVREGDLSALDRLVAIFDRERSPDGTVDVNKVVAGNQEAALLVNMLLPDQGKGDDARRLKLQLLTTYLGTVGGMMLTLGKNFTDTEVVDGLKSYMSTAFSLIGEVDTKETEMVEDEHELGIEARIRMIAAGKDPSDRVAFDAVLAQIRKERQIKAESLK